VGRADLKIAFVTPELQTLVRRTNLASTAESLAKALLAGRQDVRVFLPWTLDVETQHLGPLSEVANLQVKDGAVTQTVRVLEGKLDRLKVYLFENEPFFGSRHPYGGEEGPYADNWRRYALFTRAVLESLVPLGFAPDVIHGMDWTTGLLPLIQKIDYIEKNPEHPASEAGTFFAVHNLAMQGDFEREILPHIGIPHTYFKQIEGIAHLGKVNFLKAGVEFATIIGTHSPSHALKIQEQDRGFGMEALFQRRKKELIGINNGIDYQAWNPMSDGALAASFGPSDKEMAGKRRCKAALQAMLKLDNGPDTPLACTMGRWDADSGFDLVNESLTEILERDIELVVMGSGSREIAKRLQTLEGAFLGRLRVIEGYSAHTAHMIMGGADMLLLPSHYQPSNPLFAIGMRYGVVPLVYANGGLEDTIVDYAQTKRYGLGFQFKPYSADGFMEGLTNALTSYKDATRWRTLARRCLNHDLSWKACGSEYIKAYRRVTRRSNKKDSA
jgi:starch synthase